MKCKPIFVPMKYELKNTIKQPSKSNAFQNEKCNDLEKVINALSNGAKVVTENNGYAIEYPEGGYFKITKTIYNKVK